MVKIGIIGGSGVDDPGILQDSKKIKVHTPYGSPSDLVTTGTYNGVEVVIIPRHGPGHSIIPTNVNYRANIWALKDLGCTHVIAPTACGSLKEEIKPGSLVFVDQVIDRTTQRKNTFYEAQQVCHVAMADPFCEQLRKVYAAAADKLGVDHHTSGTMVTIEGPRFSTKAESNLYRTWGADTINMTTMPEATLAREQGLHYQPIAMVTDYDVWRENTESVSVEMIMRTMAGNADNVKKIILEVIDKIEDCQDICTEAIKSAVL